MDAVFIGGCGRSGTTLFREVLNRHPRLACGPETSLFGLPFSVGNIGGPWGLDAEHLEGLQRNSGHVVGFVERFAREFLDSESKQRWVEKTPNNVRAIGPILTWFPNARFIHIIRDGRDVVCSLRHHPKEHLIHGRVVPSGRVNPIEKTAARWRDDTADGLAYTTHPRVLEVRYEAMVSDPASAFAEVCGFIGERFYPEMLLPGVSAVSSRPGQNTNNANAVSAISTRSVGRWRSDLPAHERRTFVDLAGELLVALGYAADHSWIAEADGIPPP